MAEQSQNEILDELMNSFYEPADFTSQQVNAQFENLLDVLNDNKAEDQGDNLLDVLNDNKAEDQGDNNLDFLNDNKAEDQGDNNLDFLNDNKAEDQGEQDYKHLDGLGSMGDESISEMKEAHFRYLQSYARRKNHNNLKKVSIPFGDQKGVYPEWDSMVRPERAVAALRRAIMLYTSGLKIMTQGFETKKLQTIIQGSRMIVSMDCKDAADIKTCNKINYQMPCAATALIVAYKEFMDFCNKPSDAVIDRREFYKIGNLRRPQFQRSYLAYLRKWQRCGFQQTEFFGAHGMPLLNFRDWGSPSQRKVANPVRVREDTYLFKYFGAWRPENNKLRIKSADLKIWKNHEISWGYDPAYCQMFETLGKSNKTLYPRPIFPTGFSYQGRGEEQQTENSVNMTAVRHHVNNMSSENYKKQLGLAQPFQSVLAEVKDAKFQWTPYAHALHDLHQHVQDPLVPVEPLPPHVFLPTQWDIRCSLYLLLSGPDRKLNDVVKNATTALEKYLKD